jgi:hypothetical protein
MQKTASLHPAAVVTVVTVLGAAFGVLGNILAVGHRGHDPGQRAVVQAARRSGKRTGQESGNEGIPEEPRQTVRDA